MKVHAVKLNLTKSKITAYFIFFISNFNVVKLSIANFPKMFFCKLNRINAISIFSIYDHYFLRHCVVTISIKVHNLYATLTEGNVNQLKRFKDDVKEVAQGFECGISIEKFNDIREGDTLEAFIMEEVKR